MARLALRGITKTFPGVRANQDVSFRVAPGEIHGLIGENGAGKSTLVKIVYGVQTADVGEILWDGRPVSIASPKAARALGIGMVFQHFSLFDPLSVADNIALGLDQAIDRATLAGRIGTILAAYSLPLDLDRAVHTLSVGERQRIEIVRCLLGEPRLLIMDEPTSVLTPQEAERLFGLLRQLAAGGCAILYISHKLGEIKALCDRATVMRGGRVVGTADPRTDTTRRMAALMIGAEVEGAVRPARAETLAAPTIRLAAENLSLPRTGPFSTPLREVSLAVAAGEILGIAGIAGNGQGELVAALSGETLAPDAAMVRLDGRAVGRLKPGARRRLGLCAVPEERNGHAAVPDLSLADNAVLTARQRARLSVAGFLRRRAARTFAGAVIGRFGVKATGPGAAARSLSGGNLQKFVVGREILQVPDILVVAQPTWGVDAGAAATIHRAILDLASRGSAILLVSQDLDELLALADRICVLNEGRLSAPLDARTASLDAIGLLMGGVNGESAAVIPGLAQRVRPPAGPMTGSGENPEPTTGLRSVTVGSGSPLRSVRNGEVGHPQSDPQGERAPAEAAR